MNKNIIIASALIAVALIVSIVMFTAPELALEKLIGKAAWYIPYASIIGAIKAIRLGF